MGSKLTESSQASKPAESFEPAKAVDSKHPKASSKLHLLRSQGPESQKHSEPRRGCINCANSKHSKDQNGTRQDSQMRPSKHSCVKTVCRLDNSAHGTKCTGLDNSAVDTKCSDCMLVSSWLASETHLKSQCVLAGCCGDKDWPFESTVMF